MKTSPFATLLLLALCSCDSSSSPDNKTTTKMDAVEVQPGSISDSMIILDDSDTDGTAADDSTPDTKNDKGTDEKSAAKAVDEISEGHGEARITDPAPSQKKVEPEDN